MLVEISPHWPDVSQKFGRFSVFRFKINKQRSKPVDDGLVHFES